MRGLAESCGAGMTVAARNPEAVALEARGWALVRDGEGAFIEAISATGERVTLARFLPVATQDEMEFVADAPARFDFMDGLVARAAAKVRELATRDRLTVRHAETEAHAADPKNFAAEASMRLDEPAFLVFLEERHGLERPLTKERAVVKLRSILRVVSRAELNTDGNAAERWKAVRGDFEGWKRTGR
jgi:hypothetical protein